MFGICPLKPLERLIFVPKRRVYQCDQSGRHGTLSRQASQFVYHLSSFGCPSSQRMNAPETSQQLGQVAKHAECPLILSFGFLVVFLGLISESKKVMG